MVKLQKLFKSKFKQAALDGESNYSKMNLEVSYVKIFHEI